MEDPGRPLESCPGWTRDSSPADVSPPRRSPGSRLVLCVTNCPKVDEALSHRGQQQFGGAYVNSPARQGSVASQSSVDGPVLLLPLQALTPGAPARSGPGTDRYDDRRRERRGGAIRSISHPPERDHPPRTSTAGFALLRVNAKGLEPGVPGPRHVRGKGQLGRGRMPGHERLRERGRNRNRDRCLPKHGDIRPNLDGDLSDGPGLSR